MNIGVIGGGSLGLLMTSYLSNNHQVTLYVRRKEQLHKINEQGIALYRHNLLQQEKQINVLLSNALQAHDCIFVTVKQPQIDEVITSLLTLPDATRVIFLQNGMGHIEKIARLPFASFIGVVEHGAHRIDDSTVNHLGFGTIKLATTTPELQSELHDLQTALHEVQFPFEVHTNWKMLLKSKLLINAVINPLTALFDVPNGAVIHNRHIRKLAKKLTKEAATTLQFDESEAWERVKQIAENTKENTSSMRADLLRNRETEIEAISGYILTKRSASKLPYTYFVYESILALQERGRT